MRDHRERRTAAVVLTFLTLLCTAASAGPARVGEPEPAQLRSAHPYPAGQVGQAPAWTVHHSGATYIRLHFAAFDLMPGDSLQVSSPDGAQQFVYDGKGPHGDGEFWANTILGDTAVIRLDATVGGGFGFDIDSYGRGTEALTERPEGICGADDTRDWICHEGGPYQAEFVRARSVARLLVGCCEACTAFAVSDGPYPQYLTTHSCVASNREARDIEFTHDAYASECGGSTLVQATRFFGKRVISADSALDYALIQIVNERPLARCLRLADAPPAAGDTIYIPHYPEGAGKKISIVSDQGVGSRCAVEAVSAGSVRYSCDTAEAGSQGAPVISAADHSVVALDAGSGCPGSGTPAHLIRAAIGRKLDPCDPVPLTCGNGVIDDPGEECDGDDLAGYEWCEDIRAFGEQITCADTCRFDFSQCWAECGLRSQRFNCNCNGICQDHEDQFGCADCVIIP